MSILPAQLGSRRKSSAKKIAGRAIDAASEYKSKKMQNARFGLFMDYDGRAWLGKVPEELDPQWLMTITRNTPVSVIAEEIEATKRSYG